MKILFTGASSFTGFWFVHELIKNGHQVTAVFRHSLADYEGIRRERIKQLIPLCKSVFSCSFGSNSFLNLIEEEKNWDFLCHHAADVTNYKSADFDYVKALGNNTYNLRTVLQKLLQRGCQGVLLTGSVFEQNEGKGSDNLRAVSPYGLSKGLTADVFRFTCSSLDMPLAKFVIPNPFGPFEEMRFTSFLIQTWQSGKIAEVKTPDYVRDNIHVSLLAKAYRWFLEKGGESYRVCHPSGYVENQGAFTQRFAREMQRRLGIPCEFQLHQQSDFPEPKVRFNTDPIDGLQLGWKEEGAWDELAKYYQKVHK